MASYNKYKITTDGSTGPTYNAAAAGDTIVNGAGGILIIRTTGTITNATIVTPGSLPNGDAYPDKVIAMPATGERWIYLGPEYSASDGSVSLSWSSLTGVTWTVVSLV